MNVDTEDVIGEDNEDFAPSQSENGISWIDAEGSAKLENFNILENSRASHTNFDESEISQSFPSPSIDQGGGGRVSVRASMVDRAPTESTTLLWKDEAGIVERRYSSSEMNEETESLVVPVDLERGQSLSMVNEGGNDKVISHEHENSYLGRTITKFAQSSYIEDTITSATDFVLGIWPVQGNLNGDEEPSNQGLLREIIASFNRLFENIGAGALHGWNHSSDFVTSAWGVLEEKVKSIESQGWMNIFFSAFIVVLVASLVAQSKFIISYHHSTNLTIQQLNEVIQNMQVVQGQYQVTVSQQVTHLKSIINDLRGNLSYVQNNETSTTALNAKLADFQNNVNNQIVSNNAFVSQQVAEATDNVTINVQTMKAFVERDLDNYREEFYSKSGSFSREMESAKNSTQHEIDIMNRLMTRVQKEMAGYQSDTNNEFLGETNFVKFQLAGTFMLLACLCSGWHLGQHKTNLKNIEAQKRVMAILWMVPIYSLTSWVSLVSVVVAPYAGAVRDCYEAYAIYTFVALLVAVMEDGKGLSALVERLSEQVKTEIQNEQEAIKKDADPPARPLLPPFPCGYARAKPYSIASTWIFQCKLLAMQFVLLNPVLAVSPLVLGVFGVNVNAPSTNIDGSVNWSSLQLWCAILQNVSICVAFWGLWVFYHGTIQELEWCNPWPKFLCIKGIVFMTYYQAIVIDILSAMGSFSMSAANSYQNLLICIEMFLFAIAHVYIFPVDEWEQGYKEKREALKNEEKRIRFGDTFAMPEFFSDVRQIVTVEDFYLKGKEEKALEYIESSYDDENEMTREEGNNCYKFSCFGSSTENNDDFTTASMCPNENLVVGAVTLSQKQFIVRSVEESEGKSESEYSEGETHYVDKNEYLDTTSMGSIESHDLVGLQLAFQHEGDQFQNGRNDQRIDSSRFETNSDISDRTRSWNLSSNLMNVTPGQALSDYPIQTLNGNHFTSHPSNFENVNSFQRNFRQSMNSRSAKYGDNLSSSPHLPRHDSNLPVSRGSLGFSIGSNLLLDTEREGFTVFDSSSNGKLPTLDTSNFELSPISSVKEIEAEGTTAKCRIDTTELYDTSNTNDVKIEEMFKDHRTVDSIDYTHKEMDYDLGIVDNVDHGALVPEVVVSQGESSHVFPVIVNSILGEIYIEKCVDQDQYDQK